MLRLLEKEHNETFWNQLSLGAFIPTFETSKNKNLWTFYWFWPLSEWHSKSEKERKESEVEKELEKIEVNNLTPIEALNELNKLKSKLTKNEK
jgi:DNA mismatch repair ATPase MutS